MNINYAELYGIKRNESDFSGVIKRSLKNRVVHISENFISAINDIRNKRYIKKMADSIYWTPDEPIK